MVYTSRYDSPIGTLLLTERDGKLIGVWMECQKYFCNSLHEQMQGFENSPTLRRAKQWLDRYFAGKSLPFMSCPSHLLGVIFGKRSGKSCARFPTEKLPLTGKSHRNLLSAGVLNVCLLRR